jgi:hypothetical protein
MHYSPGAPNEAPMREKTMLQFILALIGGNDIKPW